MAKLLQTDLDANNVAKVINLPPPTAPGHAANKAYVDTAVEGVRDKGNARVRTTANINLASPGATLDSVAMALNDEFLADGQTAGAEKGKYVWNGAAVPATRSPNMNTSAEFVNAIVAIGEGTSAGTTWRQTAINITLGTTAISFVPFGTGSSPATTGAAGIAALATQAEVNAGVVTDKIVTPETLAAYSGGKKKFAAIFGDGGSTTYAITHNLGTTDVTAAVFVASTGAEVICDVNRTSANAVQLVFASAPASNAYRVVILG